MVGYDKSDFSPRYYSSSHNYLKPTAGPLRCERGNVNDMQQMIHRAHRITCCCSLLLRGGTTMLVSGGGKQEPRRCWYWLDRLIWLNMQPVCLFHGQFENSRVALAVYSCTEGNVCTQHRKAETHPHPSMQTVKLTHEHTRTHSGALPTN